MKVLLLGSGGREDALAWKISQSKRLNKLFIAPGNAGTAVHGENINIGYNDFESIKKFIDENGINMLVVGPEEPLVKGLKDFLAKSNTDVYFIGPSQKAAALEGSKDFAKKFMDKYGIPTATYKTFYRNDYTEALEYLKSQNPPYVLKADGLAAGKGVIICSDINSAKNELQKIMQEGHLGKATDKILIEEFLDGIELSAFAISDGANYCFLPEAKDYKRIWEGDKGPNTGGMGAVSPVPYLNHNLLNAIEQSILKPTVEGMKQEGIPFTGFLFMGLMIVNNKPYVIEYNVRLGDPETQAILPRIENDLLDVFEALGKEQLQKDLIKINDKNAVNIVLASEGYPQKYEKKKTIIGLDHVNEAHIFHAGTIRDHEKLLTNGGRVLNVTALANSVWEALDIAYNAVDKIQFEGKTFRKDIGKDILNFLV